MKYLRLQLVGDSTATFYINVDLREDLGEKSPSISLAIGRLWPLVGDFGRFSAIF